MVIERMQSRRSQDAGLTQPAAADLAPSPRRIDQRRAAREHRSRRRPQALRQAHGHAVEMAGDLARGDVEGHRRVVQARAIQMQREATPVAHRARRGQVVQGQGAAHPGVFKAQEARAGEVRIDGLDRALEGGEVHRAVVGLRDRLRLDRAQHRRAAAFVFVGMRLHADQVLVAARAMRQQRDEIGLRAGRAPQRGFETEIFGHARLQGVHGRVFAIHIVADLRLRHRRAHGGGRAGDGVAAQIDDVASGGHPPMMPPPLRTLAG